MNRRSTQWQIVVLKAEAVAANKAGDFVLLGQIIAQLEAIWTNDAAAQRFYTSLEQDAPFEYDADRMFPFASKHRLTD